MKHILQSLDPRELGESLRQSRIDRGFTQSEIADKLGVARTTLVAIEKGDRRVAAKELVTLAGLYGRSLSGWTESKPAPVPLVPQFRMPTKALGITEDEVMSAVSELERLARDYNALEQSGGLPMVRRHPSQYVFDAPGMTPEMRGEEVASEERTRMGLGEGPVRDLRSLLEEIVGIRIFYLDLPSTIGGIYAYTEELGACIAINRRHPAPRGVWSLAHEYGHFLSTRYAADVSLWNGSAWGRAGSEKFADAFAKNFLMPRTGVNRLLSEMVASHGKGVTAADVLSIAHQFRVSAEAMFRRLEELKRLPSGIWDKLRSQKFQPDKARSTLGFPNSIKESALPFRYRMLVRNAFEADESEMTEAEASRLLRMDRVAARDELERLRSFADQETESGFELIDLDPNKLLLPI